MWANLSFSRKLAPTPSLLHFISVTGRFQLEPSGVCVVPQDLPPHILSGSHMALKHGSILTWRHGSVLFYLVRELSGIFTMDTKFYADGEGERCESNQPATIYIYDLGLFVPNNSLTRECQVKKTGQG